MAKEIHLAKTAVSALLNGVIKLSVHVIWKLVSLVELCFVCARVCAPVTEYCWGFQTIRLLTAAAENGCDIIT